MTLVYCLLGILLLGALSYLGIRREKQERLRFEREELARLEGANGADNPAPAIEDPGSLRRAGEAGDGGWKRVRVRAYYERKGLGEQYWQ